MFGGMSASLAEAVKVMAAPSTLVRFEMGLSTRAVFDSSTTMVTAC